MLKTVPKLWGKGIHIWLGLVLLLTLSIQIITGFMMVGILPRANVFGIHSQNVYLLIVVAIVHAYYGLGLHFFGFKLKR